MTRSFEERIAAASRATVAAATELQTIIASELNAMATGWEKATNEANDLGDQRAALAAVARAYNTELEKFWSIYPAGRPANSAPGAGVFYEVLVRTQGGWAVAQPVMDRLTGDLRKAQVAAREASQRTFSARHRREAQDSCLSVLRTVNALEAMADRLGKEHDEALRRRDSDADAARASADHRLQEAKPNLSDAMRRLPPGMSPWSSPSWLSWSPVLTHSHVFLGMLRPQVGLKPGKNHGFGSEAPTPVFVPIRDALELRHRRQDRPTALALGRSLLLRGLACTPPGKLRLSIFDPTGLGQSVSSLLELGEYDRELIGGKVWSSTEDLQRLLAEHTAHIELVIQKYLRAEYSTVDEFNAAAGEIAEPYRLLAIFDAPTGFDERSFSELRRIIENGPRCGVSTLLLTDQDLPSPHGVSLDALPRSLKTLRLGVPFGYGAGTDSTDFDLTPDTDADAPDQVIRSIVHEVGKASHEAISTALSFERSFGLFSQAALEGRRRGLPRLSGPVDATVPETWWRQTTLEGVSAPIGQRGARDVATLTFDSSDHSGALLVGRPGSGKSTLLHTFIAGITTMYGPEELELHLIDFKEGVEFKVYAANSLPHARTVAIESDREFGVSVLQAIQAELAWRGSLLRGSTESHSSLETLRKATGERLPRIVLIFDEFQVLFARNDRLGTIAAEALETLIRQGRGFGIHVLLGSQSLAGLDALGSHVPQLLPVRILLPASESDVFRVLGERNTEGTALTTAGEGILNMAGGAVEANERFRGAVIGEQARRARVAAMRSKADAAGFNRRPVVFEGNAPISAEDTPTAQFLDEMRGADRRTLRLRFGAPMAIAGSADINLRRESGANVLLVARAGSIGDGTITSFSVPRAVTANLALSAVAQHAAVEIVDFLAVDEGLDTLLPPLLEAKAVSVSRRRQVPDLLKRIHEEITRRIDQDDMSSPATLLVLYGMHRARDFDQDSVDYDSDDALPELLSQIMRDGPEVGVHTCLWFETVASIGRRLPSSAVREVSWRLAGKMSADDSSSLLGVDGASSLREQQLLAVNEDRGVLQRCTTIAEPRREWIQDLLRQAPHEPKDLIQ
jgi:S-DNA-T family DNA segregation ATPase FtsK/SpoIIIE